MATTIKKIIYYPTNLIVIWDNGDHRDHISINYDAQQGEFTREEWRQKLKAPGDGGYGIQLDEDVEEILYALARRPGFKEELGDN